MSVSTYNNNNTTAASSRGDESEHSRRLKDNKRVSSKGFTDSAQQQQQQQQPALNAYYSMAQRSWKQRNGTKKGFSIYEKIGAMLALGQLMRIAAYTLDLRARIGGAFFAKKNPWEEQNEIFLCDIDFPYPTPLPEILHFQQILKDLLPLV
jgi:hypothetical protein